MSDKSKIEWTDSTWSPTRGCTKIAQGCRNCYAETFAERWRGIPGHPYEHGFDPRIVPEKLTEPLKWKKPRRIFVDSMSDLFHEAFPFEYIAQVFGVMAKANWHTYQVLTKRPARALEFLREYAAGGRHVWPAAQATEEPTFRYAQHPSGWPLPNVWIGTSISTQADADKNILILLKISAAVRFLSVEPLIEAVEIGQALTYNGDAATSGAPQLARMQGIDWVIVGGESGPGARACNVEWIRSIVAQCKAAGVPVFVKQLGSRAMTFGKVGDDLEDWPRGTRLHVGETMQDARWAQLSKKGGNWDEWPADLRVREFPQ